MDKALDAARSSGVLDLRGRSLSAIPPDAFTLGDAGEAAAPARPPPETISFDAPSSAPSWWEARELVALVASHNDIAVLPDAVAGFSVLERLELDHNRLETLPEAALARLPLRAVDVSHNRLRALPEALPVATLAKVSCSNNPNLESLPESLGDCARLAHLDASDCAVVELPRSLARCAALVSLDISGNRLIRLPENLARGLPNLRDLNASRNRLETFPDAVSSLSSLTRLDLRENAFAWVPDAIGDLPALAELYLGSNRLKELPDGLGRCASLATLDVSGNAICELRASLASAPLRLLDASRNNVVVVAPELGLCRDLRRLMLEGNPLRSIRQGLVTGPTRDLLEHLRSKLPDGATRNGALFDPTDADPARDAERAARAAAFAADEGRASGLNLRGKGLREVPSEAWRSASAVVADVDLGENPIGDSLSPSDVEGCPRLRTLALDGCQLARWPLPVEPGEPLPLVELDVARNPGLGRVAAPDWFDRCASLRVLDLSGVCVRRDVVDAGLLAPVMETLEELRWERGNLVAIPTEVFGMERLRVLRLADNKIREAPAATARLKRLEELDLTNNDVATLPPQLGLLQLRSLGVEGNPLRMIRRAVVEKGTAALLRHLRDKMPAT